MPDDPPRPLWELLAEWTQLSADRFGDQYKAARGYARGRKWEVIALEGDGVADPRREILRAAAKEADEHGFLEPMALSIARLEQNEGRDPDETFAFLERFSHSGTMQAMSNRARGLAKPDMFYVLADALEATAQVIEAGQIIGTGFLVQPDLVLTAAHVAFRHTDRGDGALEFGSQLRELSFAFRPPRGGDPHAFREIPLATSGALVSSSPPFGSPPDRLRLDLPEAADEHLDYALLRLTRQVSDIRPISIESAPDPSLNKLCFVIGYPNGGRQAWFDANEIVEVPQIGGRLWHIVNALPGMSGSCCISEKGAVGMHEGGGRHHDNQAVRNRAISLRAVRNHIRRHQNAPPRKKRASGFAIYDSEAVLAWQRKGAQLAGAGAADWQRAVEAELNISADSGAETSPFHPWFSRPLLEAWILASRSREDQRILFLHGDRGVGKSFGIEILAASLEDPERDLIRLTPSETAEWSWQKAVARLAEIEGGDVLRTEAGALRYERVEALLERLRQWGETDRSVSKRPLYLAIDTEDLGLNDPQWREFLGQAAKLPWIRLFLVGLSKTGRDTIGEVFAQSFEAPQPVDMPLDHVGLPELRSFLTQLYGQAGRTYDQSAHNSLMVRWNAPGRLRTRHPDVASAEATLIALAARREILAEQADVRWRSLN
jgi:hypothetical protein